MSRIYFHSPQGDAEASGSDRAHLGILFGDTHFGEQGNRAAVDRMNEWCAKGGPWALAARIHGQCEIFCFVRGENRAWLAGLIEEAVATEVTYPPSPYPPLLGHERPEKTTILRESCGWPDVRSFLKSDDIEPVVLSYSICEQFPDLGLVREYGTWAPTKPSWDPEEEWYDLSAEEQWRTAWDALQKKAETNRIELRPDDWTQFWYVGGSRRA